MEVVAGGCWGGDSIGGEEGGLKFGFLAEILRWSCNTKQTKLHLLQSCDLWPIKKTTTTTSIYLFISINCHPSHISPKRDALCPRPAFHAQAIQVVSADRPSASIQGTLRGGQTVGLGVLAVWHWKTWRSGIFWSILCVCIYVCIYIRIYNIYIYILDLEISDLFESYCIAKQRMIQLTNRLGS